MNPHLSQEQFARCFVGTATSEELRHIAVCATCRTELEDFGKTVASLRLAIREHVDEVPSQIEMQPIVAPESQPLPLSRWALAAAVVLLFGLVPLLTTYPVKDSRRISVSSTEALMGSVNAHLSRTVPSPMEPLMSLLPGDEIEIVWGGVQ